MQTQWDGWCDELGPEKVVLIHEPDASLRAFVVIDNVAAGPSIGGIRMSPTVHPEEVFRLARAMTLKNAAAGLPHGGGKSGIVANPRMEPVEKESLVRAFGRAIADLVEYIPGPDMGTDEACMAWLEDEIGRAVGLPRVLGGIPLDTVGATGLGLAAAAEVAHAFAGIELEGARVVVQGFGAVGLHAARFLGQRGAVLVAAADSRGAVHNPGGLDVEALIAHKRAGRPVVEFPGGERLAGAELVDVDCEIWIPAAQPDVIDAAGADRLRAKLVLCGANIPVRPEAEASLHARGVWVVPDFIANAGGVICAAVEYAGGSQPQALAVIEERVKANTLEVLTTARNEGLLPRRAAEAMAHRRVHEAMSYRRRGRRPPPLDRDLDL